MPLERRRRSAKNAQRIATQSVVSSKMDPKFFHFSVRYSVRYSVLNSLLYRSLRVTHFEVGCKAFFRRGKPSVESLSSRERRSSTRESRGRSRRRSRENIFSRESWAGSHALDRSNVAVSSSSAISRRGSNYARRHRASDPLDRSNVEGSTRGKMLGMSARVEPSTVVFSRVAGAP